MSAVQSSREWDTATRAVVVCVARDPAERARMAGSFDGTGVLVITADPRTAAGVLAGLPGVTRSRVADELRLGPLRIDLDQFTTSWADQPLLLSRHEFDVLVCLARRPGRLWTFEQLHRHAWDDEYFPGPSAVQSVVKRLRSKLRAAGVTHRLTSARGLGFRLDLAESDLPETVRDTLTRTR